MWRNRDDRDDDDSRRRSWAGNSWTNRRDDRDDRDDDNRWRIMGQQRSLLTPNIFNRNTGFRQQQQQPAQRQHQQNPGVTFLGNFRGNQGSANRNTVPVQPRAQTNTNVWTQRNVPVTPSANTNIWRQQSRVQTRPTRQQSWSQPVTQRQTSRGSNSWAQNPLLAAWAMERFF